MNKLCDSVGKYDDLLFISGHFDHNVLGSSISILEDKLLNINFSNSFVSKAKLLGVEIIENIVKHGSAETNESPYFLVAINMKKLIMLCGNSVSSEDYLILKKKLKELKTMTKGDIKKKYLDSLTNGNFGTKSNSGLGLLTIFYRSNNKPKHKLLKVSENKYHFQIEVDLAGIV